MREATVPCLPGRHIDEDRRQCHTATGIVCTDRIAAISGALPPIWRAWLLEIA